MANESRAVQVAAQYNPYDYADAARNLSNGGGARLALASECFFVTSYRLTSTGWVFLEGPNPSGGDKLRMVFKREDDPEGYEYIVQASRDDHVLMVIGTIWRDVTDILPELESDA